MRNTTRHGTLALLALLMSCDAEVERRAATQITARISIAEVVRARMTELRVQCFAQRGERWESGLQRSFGVEEIGSIVDVPFVPREGTARDRDFEIIAEAVEGAQVIAQERVLVTFVPERQRIHEMRLDACGSRPLGVLCESDPTCHGTRCLTCLETECGETPTVPIDALGPVDAIAPSAPSSDDSGSAPTAPDGSCSDARSCDAGAPARPTTDDRATPPRTEQDAGPPTSGLEPCVIGKSRVGRCVLR